MLHLNLAHLLVLLLSIGNLSTLIFALGIDDNSYYTIDNWKELSDGIQPTQRQIDLFKIIPKNSLVPEHQDFPPESGESVYDAQRLVSDKFLGSECGILAVFS